MGCCKSPNYFQPIRVFYFSIMQLCHWLQIITNRGGRRTQIKNYKLTFWTQVCYVGSIKVLLLKTPYHRQFHPLKLLLCQSKMTIDSDIWPELETWNQEPQSPLVEGDEQPYWPLQQAMQSMKINIFGFSCKNIISELDIPWGQYGCSSPATKVPHAGALKCFKAIATVKEVLLY